MQRAEGKAPDDAASQDGRERRVSGEPLCGARDEPVENFLDNAPVSQRFRRGYRLIRGVWCCQGAPVSPSVGQAPAPHLPRSHRSSWRHLWVRERATTKTRLPGRAPFAPGDVRSGSGVFRVSTLGGRRAGLSPPSCVGSCLSGGGLKPALRCRRALRPVSLGDASGWGSIHRSDSSRAIDPADGRQPSTRVRSATSRQRRRIRLRRLRRLRRIT